MRDQKARGRWRGERLEKGVREMRGTREKDRSERENEIQNSERQKSEIGEGVRQKNERKTGEEGSDRGEEEKRLACEIKEKE